MRHAGDHHRLGAFTETVIDGVTGFRCRTLAEFVDAAKRAGELDRQAIREHALRRFSTSTVRHQYDRYFAALRRCAEAGTHRAAGASRGTPSRACGAARRVLPFARRAPSAGIGPRRAVAAGGGGSRTRVAGFNSGVLSTGGAGFVDYTFGTVAAGDLITLFAGCTNGGLNTNPSSVTDVGLGEHGERSRKRHRHHVRPPTVYDIIVTTGEHVSIP